MPFSLLLVALFSIFSGPLGAFGWSERAQLNRLHSLAAELGVLDGDQFAPPPAQPDAERIEAFRSALRYLLEHFGAEVLETELAGFFASESSANAHPRQGDYLASQILEYLQLADELHETKSFFFTNQRITKTFGHSWVIDWNFHTHRNSENSQLFELEGTSIKLATTSNGDTILIYANDQEILRIPTRDWVSDIQKEISENNHHASEPILWHAQNLGWRFTFVCTNAQIDRDGQTLNSATILVFLTPPTSMR
jgi:hypothetical protein